MYLTLFHVRCFIVFDVFSVNLQSKEKPFNEKICLNVWISFSAGRTSPQLDALTKIPTLEPAVQPPPSAAPAPPAPVGQRTQTGAAAPRPTGTADGSQKPPDLLEQRKGKNTCLTCKWNRMNYAFSALLELCCFISRLIYVFCCSQFLTFTRYRSQIMNTVLLKTGILTSIKLLVCTLTLSLNKNHWHSWFTATK